MEITSPAGPDDLARLGATAVVRVMATDAFTMARAPLTELFDKLGQGEGERAGTQLEADEVLVSDAGTAVRDDVRADLAPGWRRRFNRLLELCPGADGELRDLVERLHAALPPARHRPGLAQPEHQQTAARPPGLHVGQYR